MRRRLLLPAAAALVLVAAGLAWRSADRTSRMLAGSRTCEAAAAGDWDAALAASEGLDTPTEPPAALGDAVVKTLAAYAPKLPEMIFVKV